MRETIATGVERLVQIGANKCYFLSENEHVQQNNEASGINTYNLLKYEFRSLTNLEQNEESVAVQVIEKFTQFINC